MSTFCCGIASAQTIDKSGEIVEIKGLDITSLPRTGILNYEHKSDIPGQICGKILTAKKIFDKNDCVSERELYFWNKTKVPFVYITAELLDDYCQSGKDAAGILKYDNANKSKQLPILGFSVEGSEIPNSRPNKMTVARGIARKVTLTSAPCNSLCVAELLEDKQDSQIKDDFESIFKSTEEAITLFKSGEGVKIYEQFLAKKEAEGPSQGGTPPKNPSQEYGGQNTRIGTNQSGKQVYSHGTVRPYGFNPSEHQHGGEHHNHAITTAQNPKLGTNKTARASIHSNATASGGIVENRAALSLNDKNKIADQQGKQQVAKNEKFCELHKKEPSGWSKGKVDKENNSVHYEHPEHGLLTIQKQPGGEFHVKHHGALAGVGGVKGSFSTAKEAGAHAKKYMQGVTQGTVLPNRAHNHPSPSMLGKKLEKAIEAGSYNAAPSTLTNGAAYQKESLSSSQAKTGAEENTFHGTKKKDWNKQAKDDYDRWPHREKFEKFMAQRMPHLAAGEIRAIGRTLSLKKSIDFEKSLENLISLKKSPENDKIDLVHYSSHPNLTEVSPKFHGHGVDSRTKGRETWHPHSFYYKAGTKPEDVVTGRAPHKYHAQIDPKTQPIYDIGSDPEGHVANSPNMDAVHEKLKEKGYHGFHNSKHPDLSHVVAMYHPLKVEAEKSIAKAEPPNKPEIKINPEHGKTIANAYDKMQHSPNHPEVKSAYNALIGETGNQFKNILGSGLKISKIKPGQASPYKNSKDMHHDIKQNKHLWYFPTEQGFGTEGEQPKDHPMLAQTKFTHEGKPLLANDVFRIVHDINGHHAAGETGFGPKGEHQAYLQHKKMYSPLANKALFTETAGQNNWVNYGPHGEANRANPSQTKFAEQKAGLLPDNIVNGKWHNET